MKRAGGVLIRRAVLALVLAALAGCSIDNPVGRSLGWFRYLDGADIREVCGGRSGERYRLIYNAVWGEQVRIYDIAAGPDDVGAALSVRIFFPEYLGIIDVRDPLASYRGARKSVALGPDDMAAFRGALSASGFDAPAPRGLMLPSDGFYWVIAACRDGVYHFNAFVYPSDGFAAIRFDRWLYAHDSTGVPVKSPGPSEPRRQRSPNAAETGPYSVFDMTVGENGLVGVHSPF